MTLREAALCPLRTRRGAYIKLRKLLTVLYCCEIIEDEAERKNAYAIVELLVTRVVAAGYFDNYECMMIAMHETVFHHNGVLET